MVFFACNSCGSSLKKNQVDKHIFQCRASTVSCMDCQKDFTIKEYVAHTKCVSEEEKYAGAGWKAPANFNKGEKKQQAWVDTVNETLKKAGSNLSPPCRNLLQTMAKHDNVPRKKPKFINFINNVSRNRFDSRTIETVWTLLEEQWKSQTPAAQQTKKNEENKTNGSSNNDGENGTVTENQNGNSEENGAEDGEKKLSKREKKEARKQKQNKEEKKEKRKRTESSEGENADGIDDANANLAPTNATKESKKDKKKRKRLESGAEIPETKKSKEEEDDINGNDEATEEVQDEINRSEFNWGTAIREVLLKQPDHEISMKKLKKKVLAEYYAVIGDSKGSKSQEELVSKLNKKLKKQQFKLFKDNVKLVE